MGRRPGRKSGTKEKTIKYFDYTLLFVIIFLVCFGLVMLYSTSSYNAQIEYCLLYTSPSPRDRG